MPGSTSFKKDTQSHRGLHAGVIVLAEKGQKEGWNSHGTLVWTNLLSKLRVPWSSCPGCVLVLDGAGYGGRCVWSLFSWYALTSTVRMYGASRDCLLLARPASHCVRGYRQVPKPSLFPLRASSNCPCSPCLWGILCVGGTPSLQGCERRW